MQFKCATVIILACSQLTAYAGEWGNYRVSKVVGYDIASNKKLSEATLIYKNGLVTKQTTRLYMTAGPKQGLMQTTTVTMQYNQHGHPTRTKTSSTNHMNQSRGSQTKHYRYDNSDRLISTSERMVNQDMKLNSDSETKFYYAKDGKLAKATMRMKQNGKTVTQEQHQYVYDSAGNMVKHSVYRSMEIGEPETITHTYIYDKTNQLTQSVTKDCCSKYVQTYLPLENGQEITKALFTDNKSGKTLHSSKLVSTYESGRCKLISRTNPMVIESATHNQPYTKGSLCTTKPN